MSFELLTFITMVLAISYLQVTAMKVSSKHPGKDLDGWDKNVDVMRKQMGNFRSTEKIVNAPARKTALKKKDWRRYFHKCHASVTDYIRINYRLLGYQLYPTIVLFAVLAVI